MDVSGPMHTITIIIAAALVAGAAGGAAGRDLPAGWRVVDGDTVEAPAPADPDGPLLHWRLRGYDTPETGGRAKCPGEREAAARATLLLDALIRSAARVELRTEAARCMWDRPCATLILDGTPAAEILIGAGLARPMGPRDKRGGWCGP
jgi:endonuclease YncB( thermonuclease family)